jgi:hypothetical protein
MKGKFFIVRDRYIDRVRNDSDDSGDSDDEDKEDEDEDKYYKELNQMSYINKSLDATGVNNLRFKTVCEQSPDGGDVIMTYNSDTGTFWYYCDNKDNIKFNTLDAIARKFAIEHNCKCVCVNYKEELNKAFHMVDYSAVLKQLKNSWVKPTGVAGTGTGVAGTGTGVAGTGTSGVGNKSIYATFKTYNGATTKKDDKNDTSPGPIKKHLTNRFSYKGKLNEYKPFDEKRSVGNQHTSFANFKKIQTQQKEEPEPEPEQEQEQEQESSSSSSSSTPVHI